MANIKAGVSIRDVSPKKGLPLGGYPHYQRYNTGIHDPLYGSCFYLNDGNTEIVIAALDILFFSKKYVNIVRNRVFDKCNIPGKHIMISCQHTHSGPWAAGGVDEETMFDNEDADYVDFLIDSLISMIIQAKKEAFTAKIGIGKGYCGLEQGVGGNRRSPHGPVDTDVCVIAIKDEQEVVRGIYANYALHPTVIHEDSDVVTADFSGYTRMYIKQVYPDAELVYSQGASGDQSSRYFRQGQSFDEAKRIGFEIGKAAKKVLDNMVYSKKYNLSVSWTEMLIKTRKVPSLDLMKQQVDNYKREYERLKANGASYIEVQNANLKYLGAEDLMHFSDANKAGKLRLLDQENPAEIQVLGIGDARIVGLPGEVFVEFAQDIKARSPYLNTFVVTIANGCLPGYVCTKESYKIGGYETGASFLDPLFGYEMVNRAVELLTNR